MKINESMLIESKSARNLQLADFSDERTLEILGKAKGLIHFAQLDSKQLATTRQIAEFYEVSEETIKTAFKRNKGEFESDGASVLRGGAFKSAKFKLNFANPKARTATVWTPRAALRLGMLLRDSAIAKAVRGQILNLVEEKSQPSQRSVVSDDPILAQLEQIAQVRRAQIAQEETLRRHDQELAELRAYQQAVENDKREAAERLRALPPPSSDVPEESVRMKIRRVINDYCAASRTGHQDAWRHLYQQHYLRYGRRPDKQEGEKTKLDAFVRLGLIESLYNLALELFAASEASA